jgi:hypothetical protein
MNSSDKSEIIYAPQFHPSKFENDTENIKQNLKNNRTLLSVTAEREQRLTSANVQDLVMPGSYSLTPDDKSLSGSNTRHMFKNLYGETLLTFLFFSSDNVKNLQHLIRLLVFKSTQQYIDNQSNIDLLIIMRSIFLAYSQHPKLIDEGMPPEIKQKLLKEYTNEISRLNELVLDDVVPRVVSGMQSTLDYLVDASRGLQFMPQPESTSVAGTKQYRSTTQILTGSTL